MSYNPEYRPSQSELIRLWGPWHHSTGPKTAAGKAKVAQNSYKGAPRATVANAKRLARVIAADGNALASNSSRDLSEAGTK